MKPVFSKKLMPCIIFLIILCGCSSFFQNATKSPAKENPKPELSIDSADAIFNPAKNWAHEISDLEPDPTVIYRQLSNGLRYILMNNKRPENRVSMHLYVQAGSMLETDKERGVAHFLEHMVFNGSEHFKPGELVKYFQSIGMQFGADANAHTGFYSTVYDIDLPKGDEKSLENGLLVLRDYAAGALILETEVDNERPVILSEKRTRDSVGFRTFESTFNFELPQALLPNRLPIGTKEVIQNADRQLLKTFYDTWYRPEKMILILVGDFDTKTAESIIAKKFESISPRAPEHGYPSPGEINHTGLKPFYHFEPEAGNTTVTIETITKQINPPDSKKLQKQLLLSAMAKHIINKRLAEMANDPDTPFTSASISSGIFLHYLKATDISADCAPENWKKTLSTIEQELRKALTYGFTQSEIDLAKKTFLSQLDKAVKASSTRESRSLARQIIGSLNNIRVFQSPVQKKTLKAPIIEAALPNELHEVLINEWSPDQRLIMVTGNADLKGQPNDQPGNKSFTPENQILTIYNASTQTPVEKPLEKTKVNFPYLQEPAHPGNIKTREIISDLGIVRIEFENGVKLNIKQTDFKANQVSAALIFGNGKIEEPEKKPGLGQLSQKVVNLSGLGQLTKDELKQALTGKNTHVSFQVDEDSFVLSGNTVTDETTLLFQLYHAYLVDPGFRKDAYSLALDQFAQRYDSLAHSIMGGMALKGSQFLAGGDARFGLPDFDTFSRNTLDDVKKWIKPALANAPIEISIVGDLDVESVIEAAAVYLGSLAPRSTKTVADESRRPVFPAGESLTIAVPTIIPKGMVDVSFLTGDFWNIRRNRRLSVLSQVLSDRMRIDIREKMGVAYSYYAYNDPSRAFKDYGLFHAVVQIDPDASETVTKTVRQIIDAIVAGGIKPDELNRAIKPILTSIKERVKTNNYWLQSVLNGSNRHPEQLDWCRTFETDYAAITVNEIENLAKKYLNNQHSATIVIIPDSQGITKKQTAENTDSSGIPKK